MTRRARKRNFRGGSISDFFNKIRRLQPSGERKEPSFADGSKCDQSTRHESQLVPNIMQTVRKLDATFRIVARKADFSDFFRSARPQASKLGLRLTRRGVFARSA